VSFSLVIYDWLIKQPSQHPLSLWKRTKNFLLPPSLSLLLSVLSQLILATLWSLCLLFFHMPLHYYHSLPTLAWPFLPLFFLGFFFWSVILFILLSISLLCCCCCYFFFGYSIPFFLYSRRRILTYIYLYIILEHMHIVYTYVLFLLDIYIFSFPSTHVHTQVYIYGLDYYFWS
jgi:hypothetical protein